MKNYKKPFLCLTIFILMITTLFVPSVNKVQVSATQTDFTNCKSSILIDMDTEKILYEHNKDERVPIASVTKLMTILLTLENIEDNNISLDDNVLISDNAEGMGGSQIFLDVNEEYKLGDLLKSVIVASANDSSVAIAEHIAGSERNFVGLMNRKASELNLNNTFYSNCTGLPTTDAYSTAFDQAIILKNVLKYDLYHNYSAIWMEDFTHPSGRTTTMTNTNKLSRFYSGCIGGKTGSTNQAKYCLEVGANRNNMNLISVVLGAENSKDRFNISSSLLNYGFENFQNRVLFSNENLKDMTIKIKGQNRSTHLKCEKEFSITQKNNENLNFSINYNLPNQLTCVKENQIVGNAEIVLDGVVIERINILSTETHKEATNFDYFKEIIKNN